MQKIHVRILLLGLLAAMAYGCVASRATGKVVEAPLIIPVNEQALTEDQKLVMAAMIERLRAGNPVDGVVFDPAGRHPITDPDFHYEGFGVSSIAITGYDVVEKSPRLAWASLSCAVLFKDAFGRRAGAEVGARYKITPEGVRIMESYALPAALERPAVEAYVIPSEVMDAFKGEYRSCLDLYQLAVQNAVPMTVDAAAKDAQLPPSGDYTIFVFCMDRIPDTAGFKVRFTASPGGGTELFKPLYVVENGWRAAVARLTYQPGSARSRLYFKAIYNRAPDASGVDVVVGSFENKIIPRTEDAVARQ